MRQMWRGFATLRSSDRASSGPGRQSRHQHADRCASRTTRLPRPGRAVVGLFQISGVAFAVTRVHAVDRTYPAKATRSRVDPTGGRLFLAIVIGFSIIWSMYGAVLGTLFAESFSANVRRSVPPGQWPSAADRRRAHRQVPRKLPAGRHLHHADRGSVGGGDRVRQGMAWTRPRRRTGTDRDGGGRGPDSGSRRSIGFSRPAVHR